jgi:ABC-type xylose transport system permease subunit
MPWAKEHFLRPRGCVSIQAKGPLRLSELKLQKTKTPTCWRHTVKSFIFKMLPLAGVLFIAGGLSLLRGQQQQAPDVILTNGKIITVDDRFSVAQAIAIRGKRFVAVGTNADITRLAGPNTHKIDLGGKSVIPGFIDARAHLMRAARTWAIEARFDAVPEPEVGVPSIGPKPAA